MSDGREQSYYEIALTNRQVMSIFVVLLICLLTAFISGVWIGKDGGGATVQTAEAQVITSGVREGEEPLAQMDFFDAPAGGDPASEPEPAADAPPPVVEADPPAAGPVAEKKPRGERKAAEAERRDDPPEVEPAPGPTRQETAPQRSPAVVVQKAETDTGTAAPEDIFFIQVFSSNDEAQARSVVDRLRRGSYPALLSSADIDGRMMYRVRVGPYSERDEAQKVAQRVQREYKLSTWITR